MVMLYVNDREEGGEQQTKAIHPGKSIVHNIGFRLCSTNCTLADTHIHTHMHAHKHTHAYTERERGRGRERERERIEFGALVKKTPLWV